jgi:peptidyl-prolyl cis-trans isomerase D
VVTPATGLNFAYPVIPGVAREPEVVGTVFGLTKGKVSKAIAGQRGVYMVDVTNFNEPVAITDYTPVKFQLSNTIGQRVESSVMEALKAKANIQDNRVKYY